ncbi:hypothetical protein PENSUB_12821 [Penicillium subrubescens]|uniref:Uncharacterized protein n=1 Tax=Penicillium subrubescens TaxID=1316194 RepID=A0A1Q5SW77_9EURO|nr:hypothetical protein PENSUB_12821 [Penicillium subrubescens]
MAILSAWFVDVVDTARLHAIALFCPTVRSERVFAAASPFVWEEVIQILRKIQPDNQSIPEPPRDERMTVGEVIPVARAAKLLAENFGQLGWTTMETCLEGGIKKDSAK